MKSHLFLSGDPESADAHLAVVDVALVERAEAALLDVIPVVGCAQ